MPKRKTRTIPNALVDGKVVDGQYKIVQTNHDGKTQTRDVEACEVAYDVLGIRQEGHLFVLDHIPTGMMVARFKSHNACVSAIIELMQISNFKWNAPPASIKADVKAVLERWAA